MFGESFKKEYYWELRQFSQSHSDKFRETLAPTKQYIYFFKKYIPDVIVRIQEPIQKINSWAFSGIQVLQRLNDNPRIFHWKRVCLLIRGELSIPLLQDFNKIIKDEISGAIPRRTKALEMWINHNIDDIFLVTMKPKETKQKQFSVLQIKSLTLNKYKNYFETTSWKGRSWEQLLEIADQEGLKKNSSFGLLFEQTSNSVFSLNDVQNRHLEDLIQLPSNKKKNSEHLYQQNPEKKVLTKYSYT